MFLCLTSEEVVLRSTHTSNDFLLAKSIPILLHGLETLPLKSQLTSLNFVVNRFFMRLFKSNDIQGGPKKVSHHQFVKNSH